MSQTKPDVRNRVAILLAGYEDDSTTTTSLITHPMLSTINVQTVPETVASSVRRGRKPKMITNAIATPVKRGRKPKAVTNLFGEQNPAIDIIAAEPKKRGRKPLVQSTDNAVVEPVKLSRESSVVLEDVAATPAKRGRKPKAVDAIVAEPKKRGRKPKAVQAITDELYLDPNTSKQEDDQDVEILRTRNYDMFKLSEENRGVDIRHVQSLVNSIQKKNLLSSYPIIVNSNYEIMDGQHRFKAAEMLEKSIYYRVDDNFEPEHIARINTVNKKWALDAYMKHYVAKSNKEYEQTNVFVTKRGVNIYSAVGLLSGRTAQPNNELINKFKNGEFVVKDYEYAVKVVEMRDDFSEFSDDFYKSKTFLNALSRLAKAPEYNHQKMLKKISEKPRAFKKCNTVSQYLEMLTEIVNYRSKKQVDFTKIEIED